MREGYALLPPASATRPRRPADLLWSPGVHTVKEHDAGWSSSVARWAHNPEVAGSNPAPATKARGPFSNRGRAFCMRSAHGFVNLRFVHPASRAVPVISNEVSDPAMVSPASKAGAATATAFRE